MRQITIDGVEYPSLSAASRDLRIDSRTIREWFDLKPVNLRGPVTIRGITYESATAAGKALNVTVETIRAARQHGRLENVGLRKAGSPRYVEPQKSKYAQILPFIAPLARKGLSATRIAERLGISAALISYYGRRDGIDIPDGRRVRRSGT